MGETRIQLCGPLVARIDGARLERELPGRQGRLLFAYLVTTRRRPATRDELLGVLWDDALPTAPDAALSALVSKMRRILTIEGRGETRLVLPADTWVDAEAAFEGLHRAESAAARRDWAVVWGPARVAQHVASRPFLQGETGAWALGQRRALDDLLVRSLELAGDASLHLGESEVATAERAARRLLELEPLNETGVRLLMQALERRGNRAGALLAYDALRQRLRDELGVAPSPEVQQLHKRLLGA